jgi:predicted MFS family arabinose efflux permease
MTSAETVPGRKPLWALLIGNFIIGTGVLLPAGLLNEITRDLSVSAAQGGLLMLVGGIVVALGAPLGAAFTSAFDRRKLLVFSLLLYALGHLAAAAAPNLNILLLLRAITVLGAALFTPQAAATAGLLVPSQQRAGAIAFIFIGWSAASVAGIPLGAYLAHLMGWRLVLAGMGGACLCAALLVWIALRPGLFVQPLNAAAWSQAFTSPLILTILLVTLLSMSGQMTVFSYIAPLLRDGFGGSAEQISLAFAVAGITGVTGNAIASRIVARFGIDTVIAFAIVALVLGISLFAAGFGTYTLALAGIALWGFGSFSSNSLQQSRLVAIAPQLAAATVSLNTSVVYVGQAVGAGLGGWFVKGGATAAIAWTAAAFTLASLITSLLASRLARR